MDELAEINGIKPNVFLAHGEEHEVGSTTRSNYKVKRTLDHYHCTCPAWRNQAGVPVNARTCKHLKTFLGDAYEHARIALKNPNGLPPKGGKSLAKAKETKASKALTTTSQTKPVSKRKRAADDEEDGIKAEEKPAPPKTAGGPAPKRAKVEQLLEDVEMKPVSEEKTEIQAEGANGGDELAEINGIRPLVVLQDGQETEVGSATSKNKYKIKRTFDHYYCSCPAWRNQARVPVNVRTCKHLKSLLGEAYEEARLSSKQPSPSTNEPATVSGLTSELKPLPKTKPISRVVRNQEVKDANPGNVNMDADTVKGSEDQAKSGHESKVKIIDEEQDRTPRAAEAVPESSSDRVEVEGDADELAEIDGVKPNVYMKDGEECEVKSLTSNSKYKVKRTWDHYYCSCPAWRNQGGTPVNARTCKHLRKHLGDAYESARLLKKNPDGTQTTTTTPKKTRPKGKTAKPKSKINGGGEEEGEEDAGAEGAPELLLANKWDLDRGLDPTGWWISEKLDGVRTYYDGTKMISRLGNPFMPPQWFLDKLPKDVTLDGELFAGRGKFQSTVSIVKTANSPQWKNITFQVFDVPSRGTEPFESRLQFIQSLFGPGGSHCSDYVRVVEQENVRDRQHVLDKLKEIESVGGEGVMLREPKSVYEGHRSATLYKVKTFYDAEAIVTGYVDGKGKNKGVTGALQCKMESGKAFNVGSGLTDKQRRDPPAIGSIITYRFQELTRDRVPRFPTFVGIAADKDRPKDAEVPEHKLQNGSSKGDA